VSPTIQRLQEILEQTHPSSSPAGRWAVADALLLLCQWTSDIECLSKALHAALAIHRTFPAPEEALRTSYRLSTLRYYLALGAFLTSDNHNFQQIFGTDEFVRGFGPFGWDYIDRQLLWARYQLRLGNHEACRIATDRALNLLLSVTDLRPRSLYI